MNIQEEATVIVLRKQSWEALQSFEPEINRLMFGQIDTQNLSRDIAIIALMSSVVAGELKLMRRDGFLPEISSRKPDSSL